MGKVIRWTLLVVVLIIFGSGGVAFYTVFFRPEGELQVPILKDRSIVEAVAEAERLGLVVQVEHVASTLAEGRVLAQYPESGNNIRKGQVIVLQVSKGGELRTVPDLRNQTFAKAQNLIKEHGFTLGDVIRIKEPEYQPGIVIAQSPASPANIASGRKIDLLIQDGTITESPSNVLKIPDVNRMTEKEARETLDASGIKIQAVDRVYSPLLPEGVAIETKPAAGASINAGQSVILKLSTQRRPAGFIDANTQAQTRENGSVRRVTHQPPAQTNSSTQVSTQNTQSTPVRIPPIPKAEPLTVTNNKSENQSGNQPDAEDLANSPEKYVQGNRTSRTQNRTQTQTQTRTTPASSTASTTQSTSSTASTPAATRASGSKTTNVRYIVPPLASPMSLRIEVTDPTGRRDIFNRQVRSGESINAQATYTQECVVTIYLGGQSVWQERHR